MNRILIPTRKKKRHKSLTKAYNILHFKNKNTKKEVWRWQWTSSCSAM